MAKGTIGRELELGRLATEALCKMAADLTAAEEKAMSEGNQMNNIVWPALRAYKAKLAEMGVGQNTPKKQTPFEDVPFCRDCGQAMDRVKRTKPTQPSFSCPCCGYQIVEGF